MKKEYWTVLIAVILLIICIFAYGYISEKFLNEKQKPSSSSGGVIITQKNIPADNNITSGLENNISQQCDNSSGECI